MVRLTWMDRASRQHGRRPGQFLDVARFGGSDTDDEVEASLSCMVCLQVPEMVTVSLVGQLPIAVSRCGSCEASTVIELSSVQARRLLADGYDLR
jgi:succinyl-CoA synthetase beta subunit